jgi:hypothetical protein
VASFATGLLLCVLAANPRADECGPKQPIKVTAVCGRTVLGVGWMKPELAWSYARSLPDVPLELTDRQGRVIASTTADAEGRFAFKDVRKGSYLLQTSAGADVAVSQPLTVTETNATCSRPIYAYVDIPGWPCRNWATLLAPVDLQPFEPDRPDYSRIVPPRPWQQENCVVETSRAAKYASVSIGDDGRVTLVTGDCQRLAYEETPRSLGNHPYRTSAKAAVSTDRSAAAWLAMFRECDSCSDDVLPLEVVIVRDGKTLHVAGAEGAPIWYWMFQDGGRRVAFMEGTRMGDRPDHYELWDVAAGKRLADYKPKWDQNNLPAGPKPPKWVRDLDVAEREGS